MLSAGLTILDKESSRQRGSRDLSGVQYNQYKNTGGRGSGLSLSGGVGQSNVG